MTEELEQKTYLFAYDSMKDKVDIKSLALELHTFVIRSIKKHNGPVEKVNLICFSTGGLIVRTFLMTYWRKHYQNLIHRLIMLAPANMGSPFAKMGKEKIGKVKDFIFLDSLIHCEKDKLTHFLMIWGFY